MTCPKILLSLQEVQRETRESDIGHSNVVTLGNQRQRNGGSDQSHTAQKQAQQQVSIQDICVSLSLVAFRMWEVMHFV